MAVEVTIRTNSDRWHCQHLPRGWQLWSLSGHWLSEQFLIDVSRSLLRTSCDAAWRPFGWAVLVSAATGGRPLCKAAPF
eukprot:239905-Amphidinium_carterae.1